MSEIEILHEGEVGPELEEYINSLLDRTRELQNTVADLQTRVSGMADLFEEIATLGSKREHTSTISEYINAKHGGKI